MQIGGLQKLTLLDFSEKMACIVFLNGCNLRCPYCHNSGLVLPELFEEAIEEEALFRFLKKRQGLLDGVCVTGGEPLLHKEIVPFLEKIKELGYAIKLDTNGSFPTVLKEVVEKKLVDYVAMDIKHQKEKYDQATGCALSLVQAVEESVSYLKEGHVPFEFRTTLVKGIHEAQDVEAMSRWVGESCTYYLQNFKDSGSILGFIKNDEKLSPFTEEEMEEFRKIALKYNKNVIVRNV